MTGIVLRFAPWLPGSIILHKSVGERLGGIIGTARLGDRLGFVCVTECKEEEWLCVSGAFKKQFAGFGFTVGGVRDRFGLKTGERRQMLGFWETVGEVCDLDLVLESVAGLFSLVKCDSSKYGF